ncbi:hypothetical protein GGX14DRAFT_635712 [Mycena pura]|uniref:Uncharacterized protein n=1 Tax=Mycena pura TaxID=153505 RepID=A0AAD6VAT7_9AGAR|nr:hypothetical protein GGX14DRAFT_635712 [Mycena pura]
MALAMACRAHHRGRGRAGPGCAAVKSYAQCARGRHPASEWGLSRTAAVAVNGACCNPVRGIVNVRGRTRSWNCQRAWTVDVQWPPRPQSAVSASMTTRKSMRVSHAAGIPGSGHGFGGRDGYLLDISLLTSFPILPFSVPKKDEDEDGALIFRYCQEWRWSRRAVTRSLASANEESRAPESAGNSGHTLWRRKEQAPDPTRAPRNADADAGAVPSAGQASLPPTPQCHFRLTPASEARMCVADRRPPPSAKRCGEGATNVVAACACLRAGMAFLESRDRRTHSPSAVEIPRKSGQAAW